MIDYGEKIWMNGEFIDADKATVHVMSHALHYGTSVFEGIKSYFDGEQQIIFRLDEHITRLRQSANTYGWDYEYTDQEIKTTIIELVKMNQGRNLYIRPFFFFGTGYDAIDINENVVKNFIITTWPMNEVPKDNYSLTHSSFVRPPLKVLNTQSKCAANYVNSNSIKVEAQQKGFKDAIALDINGNLAEISAANLFFIKDDILHTPDIECSILNGITRQTIIKIATDLGIKVQEGKYPKATLDDCQGAFVCGTATEMVWVKNLDGKEFDEHIYFTKIWEVFHSILYKQNQQYKEFITLV